MPFVPLVSGGAGAPLFLLHPATPMPWCYRPFVEHATWDRPVYAARGVELDWDHELFSIHDLVVQYLIEMRRVQPNGPYLIGGWSFGGVLAFEMACRLMADGQHVQRLIMFDTHAPATGLQRGLISLQFLTLDLLRALARSTIGRAMLDRIGWTSPVAKAILLLRIDRPLTPDVLREILDAAFPELSAAGTLRHATFEQLCDILVGHVRPLVPEAHLKDFDRAFPTGRSTDFIRFQQVRWKNHWVGRRYRVTRIYPGRITIYAADDNHRVAGWQPFSLQPLDIRRLPIASCDGLSTHLSFFDSPNVTLFAPDVSRLVQTA